MTKSIEEQDRQLRIKMNKLVESKFDTNSITEVYHKLFVDMVVYGAKARDAQLLEVVNELRDALKFYANKENYESKDTNRITNNKVYDIVLFDFTRNLEPKKDFAGSKARQSLTKVDQMLKEMGI